MNLKVEIISRETIKPSSPTPSHITSLNLSLIDQFYPNGYVHLILFYSAIDSVHHAQTRLKTLKTSLSNTLTRFYPLAGTIKDDNRTIVCDDAGVKVLITRVNSDLSSHVLNPSDLQQLDHLLPREDRDWKSLLAIQLNVFECGGIAIGVYMNHKIADASSLCFFLNTWASMTARADEGHVSLVASPVFDFSSLFPARDVPMLIEAELSEEKIVSKKFVFDASMIASLKAKSSFSSRVMAVTAFLWRVAMGPLLKTPSIMEMAVNLRGRMDPQLSETHFGNLSIMTVASISPTMSLVPSEDELVEKMRGVLRGIDGDYIKKLQVEDEYLKLLNCIANAEELFVKGETVRYTVSSWCGFPFYGVDFGWGRPAWVTTSAIMGYKNLFLLMDTRCGEGVEALVVLGEEDMKRLRSHPEFLQFFALET